jgi:transcriptional regulator ATRX
MKRRAHVLHKLLDGCVQRLDYSVLTPYLPPKFEYAITINLSEKQKELYVYYLRNLSGNQSGGATFVAAKLFKDYQSLVKVWTHPIVLTFKALKEQKSEAEDSEGSMKDFIADDTSEGEN